MGDGLSQGGVEDLGQRGERNHMSLPVSGTPGEWVDANGQMEKTDYLFKLSRKTDKGVSEFPQPLSNICLYMKALSALPWNKKWLILQPYNLESWNSKNSKKKEKRKIAE